MKALNFKDIKVPNNIDFKDISGELWRTYLMQSGNIIRIDDPVALYVTKTGSHYVIDRNGIVTYVRPLFEAIQWEKRENEPHIFFVGFTSNA